MLGSITDTVRISASSWGSEPHAARLNEDLAEFARNRRISIAFSPTVYPDVITVLQFEEPAFEALEPCYALIAGRTDSVCVPSVLDQAAATRALPGSRIAGTITENLVFDGVSPAIVSGPELQPFGEGIYLFAGSQTPTRAELDDLFLARGMTIHNANIYAAGRNHFEVALGAYACVVIFAGCATLRDMALARGDLVGSRTTPGTTRKKAAAILPGTLAASAGSLGAVLWMSPHLTTRLEWILICGALASIAGLASGIWTFRERPQLYDIARGGEAAKERLPFPAHLTTLVIVFTASLLPTIGLTYGLVEQASTHLPRVANAAIRTIDPHATMVKGYVSVRASEVPGLRTLLSWMEAHPLSLLTIRRDSLAGADSTPSDHSPELLFVGTSGMPGTVPPQDAARTLEFRGLEDVREAIRTLSCHCTDGELRELASTMSTAETNSGTRRTYLVQESGGNPMESSWPTFLLLRNTWGLLAIVASWIILLWNSKEVTPSGRRTSVGSIFAVAMAYSSAGIIGLILGIVFG